MKTRTPTELARAILGSAAWSVFSLFVTIFFGTIGIVVALFLPYRLRYRFFGLWSRSIISGASLFCGFKVRIEGEEHIPDKPGIVLSKHQSAWETLALQALFPPQTWVLKRELMWIPFLGWALRLLEPIAINRSSTRDAMKQMIAQGRRRLAQNRWVVVFPEGTRIPPGQQGRYRKGGAVLACETGARITPVAHNAGVVWPKNSFLKYPGEITVRIGPPIDPAGKDANQVLEEVQAWIERESLALLPT